jgi:serine/threonine protein kinase
MTEQRISHFLVLRKLGAGGMGEVYLAEDTRLGRQVAIKLLPPDLADDPQRRQRFIIEAKSASALNHPHVCVIFEVGETEDKRPFIAMEFLEGKTLDVALRDGPLDIHRLVAIAAQIADALDAAHAKQIVHRDIKPANICLNKRDQVKVLDFGLAKRLAFNEPEATIDLATQDGQILGTPNYMSPEQAWGKEIDARTDIFSLGVIVYQMATGRLPFAGLSLADTLSRITTAQPEAIARFNYDVPVELERITLKCLQKDPERRYQSARELMVDLENLKQVLATSDETGVYVHGAGIATGSVIRSGSATPRPKPSVAEVENSDIIISCAQIDDEPLPPDHEGWTSQFQRNLSIRVEQLLGEPVRITSCPMPTGEQPYNETLLDHLPSAKTLISVVSPPFTKSKGCCRSVEKFCGTDARLSQRSRLFKVMKTPVSGDEVPAELAARFSQVLSFQFYEEDPDTGRMREFDEVAGGRRAEGCLPGDNNLRPELGPGGTSARVNGPRVPGLTRIPSSFGGGRIRGRSSEIGGFRGVVGASTWRIVWSDPRRSSTVDAGTAKPGGR